MMAASSLPFPSLVGSRRAASVGLALLLLLAVATPAHAQPFGPFTLFNATESSFFDDEVAFEWQVLMGATVAEVQIYANSQLVVVEPEPSGGWGPNSFFTTWDTRGFVTDRYTIQVFYDDGTGNLVEAVGAVPQTFSLCPPAEKVLGTYPAQAGYSFPKDEFVRTQWNLHNVSCIRPGDLDFDKLVTEADLVILKEFVGGSGPGVTPTCLMDLNTDGVVDSRDVDALYNFIRADFPDLVIPVGCI